MTKKGNVLAYAPWLIAIWVSVCAAPLAACNEAVCEAAPGAGSESLALDPRFFPLTESWVAQLPVEYPIFPEGKPSCAFLDHSNPHPTEFRVDKQYGPPYGYAIDVAPKHLRVKLNTNGTPSIRLHKNLLGKFYYVDVEFELGIFGEEKVLLKKALLGQGVQWKRALLENVRILPIDPAWNAEVGAIDESKVSLYSQFTQVDAGNLTKQPTSLEADNFVMWSGRVSFVTSRSGTELMDRVAKRGLFNFPVVALFEVRAVTYSGVTASRPSEGESLFTVQPVQMVVPGGLACLTRNFWGRSHVTTANGCEHYWMQ